RDNHEETTMRRRPSFLALAALAALAGPSPGEKVPLSPRELRDTATHVVTGKVQAVYHRSEDAGDWRYTRYVAEVRVAECEKGPGLKKGDLVYARYWRRSWVGKGKMPPSTVGHRGLPSAGDGMRVYLSRSAYDGFGDNSDGG